MLNYEKYGYNYACMPLCDTLCDARLKVDVVEF
jgi:hypothetical protein